MTVKDGKIVGLRQDLERRVAYEVRTKDVSEPDMWKAIYDIALRKLTLIYG